MSDLSPTSFDFRASLPDDEAPSPVALGAAALACANWLPATTGRILLVEPSPLWHRELALFLGQVGYTVFGVTDALTGLNRFFQAAPIDLVLVAAEMPDLNGLHFCALLRQSSYVPIILLNDCSNADLVLRSIALGADDCVNRSGPWILLHARMRAIIQRICAFQQSTCRCVSATAEIVVHEAGGVTVRDQPVDLTPLEVQLLHYLMERAGYPVSIRELMQKVWGYDENAKDVVRVAICRLRQKIESDPNHPQYIMTVPGIGYGFGLSAAQ